ncbi:MAG: DUF4442 domain-containing protein [Flavobacteriaceae bacterium]
MRVKKCTETYSLVTVKHSWFNSNPFNSMFWAVQGMAAELSTGILIMQEIRRSKQSVSMLVVQNKANFSKKATGSIRFQCEAEDSIQKALAQAIKTKQGVTFWLNSQGFDTSNDCVSSFDFQWSIKVKNT